MLVGYTRVSTDGDRRVPDLQREALLFVGAVERPLHEDHTGRGKAGWRRSGVSPARGLPLS